MQDSINLDAEEPNHQVKFGSQIHSSSQYSIQSSGNSILTFKTNLSSLRTSLLWIELKTSQLVAWCSNWSNKISLFDLENQENYANFDGVDLRTTYGNYVLIKLFFSKIFKDLSERWTHVMAISSMRLLVSLHHVYGRSANMKIFSISSKGQVKPVYTFEEVLGGI